MALSAQGQAQAQPAQTQPAQTQPAQGQPSDPAADQRRRIEEILGAAEPASPPRSTTPPPSYPQPQGYPRPQARPAARTSQAPGPRPRPSREPEPNDLLDEVEFVLQDARERAQQIIDESMERARELIQRERAVTAPVAGIDPSDFDDLRRSLRGLVTEVRDIQQRLARIEELLREQQRHREPHAPAAATPTSPPATAPAPTTAPAPVAPDPRYSEPPYGDSRVEEPAPAWREPEPYAPYEAAPPADVEPEPAPFGDPPSFGGPSSFGEPEDLAAYPSAYRPWEPSAPEAAPEPRQPEATWESQQPEATSAFHQPEDLTPPGLFPPPAPHAPAPAPPRSPFSVVPPQRREWEPNPPREPFEEAREEEDAPPPPPSPSAEAWLDEIGYETDVEAYPPTEQQEAASPGSPLVTFLPSDGAITLRVTPVAGFQGLMRVQDALARLPAVRHASVEAYSQGEARLRIELADPSDSDELAEGLSRGLRAPARVEDASEVHRELLIALR